MPMKVLTQTVEGCMCVFHKSSSLFMLDKDTQEEPLAGSAIKHNHKIIRPIVGAGEESPELPSEPRALITAAPSRASCRWSWK